MVGFPCVFYFVSDCTIKVQIIHMIALHIQTAQLVKYRGFGLDTILNLDGLWYFSASRQLSVISTLSKYGTGLLITLLCLS